MKYKRAINSREIDMSFPSSPAVAGVNSTPGTWSFPWLAYVSINPIFQKSFQPWTFLFHRCFPGPCWPWRMLSFLHLVTLTQWISTPAIHFLPPFPWGSATLPDDLAHQPQLFSQLNIPPEMGLWFPEQVIHPADFGFKVPYIPSRMTSLPCPPQDKPGPLHAFFPHQR